MERAGDEVASWFGDRDAEQRRTLDEHRGKGPKGYQRSDARIEEDINDRLSDDPMLDASNITVTVKGAEVTLDGFVSSRLDKRRAEDLADDVSGVRHVQNNLRLNNGSSDSLTGSTTV
jgi:osmotically-inducible protein OsmY